MNRFIYTLFIALILTANAHAQDTVNFRYGYIPKMKVMLLAIDGLIDPKNFIESSLEYKIAERQSVEYALGVYLPRSLWSSGIETNGGQTFEIQNLGFRLRVNWKIYEKMYWGSHHKNNYFAPEFMFNYSNLKATGWYNRFEDAYQQYLSANRNQTAIGLGIKFGEQLFMSQKTKKVYLDYFMGLGIRTLIISNGKNTPDDILPFNGERAFIPYTNRTAGTYWHPYINWGLKIGLVLK